MNTTTRLAVFAAGLLLAFAAAWGVGAAVSPILEPPAGTHDGTGTPTGTHDGTHDPADDESGDHDDD